MRMSSATNKVQGPLEKAFQHRMLPAEASPSPELWERIDHQLTLQENVHYKKRMLLYRQLAAACFVLFVLTGALLTYNVGREEGTVPGTAGRQSERPVQPAGNLAAIAGKRNTEHSLSGNAMQAVVPPLAAATELASASLPLVQSSRRHKAADFASMNGAAAGPKTSDEPAGQAALAEIHLGADLPEAATTSEQLWYPSARRAIAAVPPSFSTGGQKPASAQSLLRKPEAAIIDVAEEEGAWRAAEQNKALALHTAEASQIDAGSRWSVGMGYVPAYFNQNIGLPHQGAGAMDEMGIADAGVVATFTSAQNMREAREEFEKNTEPGFSFGVEAKAGLKLGRHLTLLSGMGFTQNTARTKSSYVISQFWTDLHTSGAATGRSSSIFLPALNTNLAVDSVSVAQTENFYVHYRYRHLTLPVGLQYAGTISKDWFWYAAGGLAANFLLETSIRASDETLQQVRYGVGDDSPFRKVQFSGNASLGIGKHMGKGISLAAGPEWKGFFDSLLNEPSKALAPQGRPYTMGINLSVHYELRQR